MPTCYSITSVKEGNIFTAWGKKTTEGLNKMDMPPSIRNMTLSSVIYSVSKQIHACGEKTPPKLTRINQQFWLIGFGGTQPKINQKAPFSLQLGSDDLTVAQEEHEEKLRAREIPAWKILCTAPAPAACPREASDVRAGGDLHWAAAEKEYRAVKARIYWKPRFVLFS